MRWLVVVVVVSGCTYYTVAPDEARRIAAMSREQREWTAADALRDDGKTVRINPARLKLVEPWHDGEPRHLRRPPHPALVSGAVVAVVGLAFIVPGAIVMSSPVNDTQAGNCDICAFSYGYGQSMAGGALIGVGAVHLVAGAIALVFGATQQTHD